MALFEGSFSPPGGAGGSSIGSTRPGSAGAGESLVHPEETRVQVLSRGGVK